MTSVQLFNLTTIGYFVAMILFIAYLVTRSRIIALTATIVAWVGFATNTAAITLRWFEGRAMGYSQAPLSNLYESIVFFAWSILFIYLLMDLKYRQRAVGAFVMPFAFLGMTWAQLGLNDAIEPLVPALQSNWLTYHVITCFLGYAAFAVACGASIMYLLIVNKNQESGFFSIFPSSKVLDDINYKSIMIGFPLLTLGIVTGAAWANYAWGTYWSWDPKETWSLIVWFIYAAFLHARFTRGWAGKRAAWLSIFGFAATIFCYLGVNLVLSGLHSYGS
ncbi:MAG: c-type cytochrome biogenesis protein CcsB [Desulfuromonadales bacterium]|nr:c-type cytochrome biogenesis protein CcsB [Desulfuromonadales bacterium]MDT8424263.1 c-type cytochrome biogenesis protein CcsB [Desulfuromonadales bacterium]